MKKKKIFFRHIFKMISRDPISSLYLIVNKVTSASFPFAVRSLRARARARVFTHCHFPFARMCY